MTERFDEQGVATAGVPVAGDLACSELPAVPAVGGVECGGGLAARTELFVALADVHRVVGRCNRVEKPAGIGIELPATLARVGIDCVDLVRLAVEARPPGREDEARRVLRPGVNRGSLNRVGDVDPPPFVAILEGKRVKRVVGVGRLVIGGGTPSEDGRRCWTVVEGEQAEFVGG